MNEEKERNLGEQPIAKLMDELLLKPADLVRASTEHITHKMVSRACKGRWLTPHVNREMQLPVTLYIVVISAMLLCAGLTAGQPAAPFIIGGAWGFACSDLAVARRQFIQPASRLNGVWGTPLYFLAQMVLASSLLLV